MISRTNNVKRLLYWSEKIDKKPTDFNNDMYNKILLQLKFEGVKKDISEDELRALDIIKFIGYIYQLPEYYNTTKVKTRKYVIPRQIAMNFIKCNTGLSLSKIGKLFGNKDHALVLYSLKTIYNLYETDKLIKKKINLISNKLELKFYKYET